MKIVLNRVGNDKNFIVKIIKDFLQKKGGVPQSYLSVTFESKAKIKKLNQKYRRIASSTDVLSFPIWPNIQTMPKTGTINLGDIFVCPDIVRANANRTKISYRQELARVIEHSLDHLLGRHH